MIGMTQAGYLSGRLSGGASGGGGIPGIPSGTVALPLVVWDSQVGIALNGGNVTTWTDIVRGLVLTDGGASTRPAYTTDGANFLGKSVVVFDGTDDLLRNLSVSPAIYANSKPHFVMVLRCRTAGSQFNTLAISNAADSDLGLFYRGSDGSAKAWWLPASNITTTPAAAVDQNVYLQDSFCDVGNALNVRVNGGPPVADSLTVAVTGPADKLWLGTDRELFGFSPVNIAAIAIYPARLSASDYNAVRAYYTARYGTP